MSFTAEFPRTPEHCSCLANAEVNVISHALLRSIFAMVNRSVSDGFRTDGKVEYSPGIGLIFSAIAVSRHDEGEDSTAAQIAVLSNVIDRVLIEMATEGYAQPTPRSEVSQTLNNIRRTGRLAAAPTDKQSRLEVNCSIPMVGEIASCLGDAKARNSWTPPSKAWADLGAGSKYVFVGHQS